MYEDLNKRSIKTVLLTAFLLVFSIAMLLIVLYDLFGFVNLIADSSFPPERVRLYGGIFFAIVGLAGLCGLLRALKDTPMKGLIKYANKTQQPEAALERLKETWKSGLQICPWCRMDEAYLIAVFNGANAVVVSIKDVAWAYQTTTRYNYLIKTGTSLYVHYANRKIQGIPLNEKAIASILQQLMEKHRDIAVGHSDEAEKLYQKKDMAGLKEYARRQRAGVDA